MSSFKGESSSLRPTFSSRQLWCWCHAARHLAKLGAQVAIVGRSEKKLSEVVEQIKKVT